MTTTPKTETQTPQNDKGKTTPAFNVYASIPNGRGSKIGSKIGVIWKHNNGDGMNIVLDAQPIPYDGQAHLTVFPYEPRK